MKRFQNAVESIKRDREMEGRYMLFEEMLKDEKAEGKAEGRVEGKAESIIDLLSDLGTVSEELREKILEERNFDTLRSYLRKAAKARSVEEFEVLINE